MTSIVNSTKRARSTSLSSSNASSLSPSRSSSPAPKYACLSGVVPELASLYSSLTCTLPPTCSLPNHSTRFESSQQAEDHYRKFHTHVCEYPKCRCVFPDARFLELHITECHDPIAAVKRERQSACGRVFSTPKGRRLHLIEVHGYPKQYFFGVVNKGIGGLYKKWGPAASLYRGEWKTREGFKDKEGGGNEMEMADDRNEMGSTCTYKLSPAITTHTPIKAHSNPGPSIALPTNSFSLKPTEPLDSPQEELTSSQMDMDLDNLSQRISSLSLVPDKIRFGRGGKKNGFAQPGQKRQM